MHHKKILFRERMARVKTAKERKITGKQSRLNLWLARMQTEAELGCLKLLDPYNERESNVDMLHKLARKIIADNDNLNTRDVECISDIATSLMVTSFKLTKGMKMSYKKILLTEKDSGKKLPIRKSQILSIRQSGGGALVSYACYANSYKVVSLEARESYEEVNKMVFGGHYD